MIMEISQLVPTFKTQEVKRSWCSEHYYCEYVVVPVFFFTCDEGLQRVKDKRRERGGRKRPAEHHTAGLDEGGVGGKGHPCEVYLGVDAQAETRMNKKEPGSP